MVKMLPCFRYILPTRRIWWPSEVPLVKRAQDILEDLTLSLALGACFRKTTNRPTRRCRNVFLFGLRITYRSVRRPHQSSTHKGVTKHSAIAKPPCMLITSTISNASSSFTSSNTAHHLMQEWLILNELMNLPVILSDRKSSSNQKHREWITQCLKSLITS